MTFTRCARILALALFAATLSSQTATQDVEVDEPRLPNRESQKQEILKANHKRNLADAAKLVALAEGLKAELEKNEHFVLSLASLKKTDDIEKLARSIRNRLKQY